MEQTRSRITWKDIAIAVVVLALLAALVWLFLRPVEPARQIVFGDLGRQMNQSNSAVHGPVPQSPGTLGSNEQQEIANMPMTNDMRGGSNDPSARRMEPPAAEQGRGLGGGNSNSVSTGLSSNTVSQNASSNSSNQTPIAPGVAVPTPSSPAPPVNYSSVQAVTNHWAPDAETPLDPSRQATTARLLAEAKAANMPRVNHAPDRTADLLGNDAPARLFDPAVGSNVVFMLDNSMDMLTNGKSVFARQEVVRALESMSALQSFYILFFHSGGYESMPSLAPQAATSQNINTVTNWLFSVGHRPGADPTKAMQRALGLVPAPDTVWLLSGGSLPDNVIDNIRQVNFSVNARINTIALYTGEGEPQLRQLADENRGAYRFVPPPGASPP